MAEHLPGIISPPRPPTRSRLCLISALLVVTDFTVVVAATSVAVVTAENVKAPPIAVQTARLIALSINVIILNKIVNP